MTQPSGDARLRYEDIEVGRTLAFGRRVVTAEEIMAFGRAFDPQPSHISEETAADTTVGRLIASGYHTCALMMKMLAEDVLAGSTSLGSPGLEEAKFLKPVLPGDELSARYTCLEKRELKSRPGVGLTRINLEMINGRGEVVLTWDCVQLLRVAEAGGKP